MAGAVRPSEIEKEEGKKMHLKRMAYMVLTAAAASLMAAAPSYASSAQTESPRVADSHPIACDGDLCIQQETLIGGFANVHAWADSTRFTGHFQLKANSPCSDHSFGNSPDETWHAGGAGYIFDNIPQSYGGCEGDIVIAWKKLSDGSYQNIGQVTFHIS